MENGNNNNFRSLPVLIAAILLPVILGSCQIPPTEVLRGIQRETLVGYFAREHLAALYEEGPRLGGGMSRALGSAGERGAGAPPVARRNRARPECVDSPFVSAPSLVDVSAFCPGELALCPYTGKRFLVPALALPVTFEPMPPGPAGVVRPHAPAESTASGEDSVRHSAPRELPKSAVAPGISDAVEPIVSVKRDKPEMPVGVWVEGKPGYVYSPFADKAKIVDLTGLEAGTMVRCPYSGKLFLVPPSEGEADESTASGTSAAVARGLGGGPMLAAPKPKVQVNPDKGPEFGPEPMPEEPVEDKPAASPKMDTKPATDGAPLPVAKWADAKPGYAISPYGNFLVDVRGKSAGSIVRCPFTGKLFKLPEP